MPDDPILSVVGRTAPRVDAAAKTTGAAVYTTDIVRPGMLHAKVLRSPRAHARITAIDAGRARRMPGVHAVLTGPDLDRFAMPVYGYFIKDQPIVARDKVRYEGDIVAAVAADSEAAAEAALAEITVAYEDLGTVPDIEAALAPGAPELFEEAPVGIVPGYGEGASASLRPLPNVCYEFRYKTGPSSAFDGADHVFEDSFGFSRMHHFHLEPFVTVAEADEERIEVWTSCQNPFPLRKEIARIFGTGEHRVTVNVPFLGGGFGSKNNCKTEPVAIALALMTGRPVRFCLTLEEGFFTNTQHAAQMTVRTGVMADGTLVARQAVIRLDAGAYSDGSPLVAEKVGYRIAGPYRWAHVDSLCQCVMTNTAPAGPFRGFGATQTTWAGESQIDMIARRLGIDPYDLRMKNLKDLGEPYMPGESGIDSDLRAGLDLVAQRIGYRERPRRPGRGMGLSIGFKDGGGVNKPAQARVKVATSGDIFLHCGSVEMGQGARTALGAVVAEILAAPAERVTYAALNTDTIPFDQGTNASSAVAVMGQAVAKAARAVRDQVLAFAAGALSCETEDLVLDNWSVRRGNESHPLAPLIMRHFGGTGFEFTADGFFKSPHDDRAALETPCVFWEIGWAAADVEVDVETGEITVHEIVVSGDAGRAINPQICRGQDEGAAVMGMGQALFERMIHDGAHLANADALLYRVPLAEDLPRRFTSITQEQGHGPGPFGAKGMGEGGMLPIASAIANAIDDAVGVRLTELPLTPASLLEAMARQREAG